MARLTAKWANRLTAILGVAAFLGAYGSAASARESSPAEITEPSPKRSYFATTVEIPMRDGATLVANLVTPGDGEPAPTIVSITPYGRHAGHRVAAGYAQAGFAFLAVDLRGRGDSTGKFTPFYSDIDDTIDVLAWAAAQSFSNGQTTMWGSSYGGYNQWMAAAKGAPSLVTITPAAAVYPGWDFPSLLQIGYPYSSIWTGFTKGRSANFALFGDQQYWREAFSAFLAEGAAFTELDERVGFDTDLFDEWAAHPSTDAYWQAINPSKEELAAIDMPVLSITGLYDGAQLGALRYYDDHMAAKADSSSAPHYIVIGPYDHAGVLFPTPSVGGLPVPESGGMDPIRLLGEWYGWTMAGAPRPEFLRDKVMYYVMGEGANEWRSAPSLADIPVTARTFHLSARPANPTAVDRAGTLTDNAASGDPLSYRFDPADRSKADLGSWFEGKFATYDDDVQAIDGEGLIFETAVFDQAYDIVGRPRFEAQIGIDTPDADFQLRIYEILPDGTAVYLSETRQRARYRGSSQAPSLIQTSEPLPYTFEHFSFISRRVQKGSRLRFVFGSPNSIYIQRNYNAAIPVADQTVADALPVRVTVMNSGQNAAKLMLPMRAVE